LLNCFVEISPASTPQCSNLRCAKSSRSHGHDGQPSFFGRLAGKFTRKRYAVVIIGFISVMKYTGWSKKTDTQFYFWDNFGNSAPISTILSLLQAEIYGA